MKTNNTTFDGLRDRITFAYGSLDEFADRISMRPEKLISKLDGEQEFDQEEIVTIHRALNLSDDEIREFFFPDYQPAEETHSAFMLRQLDRRRVIERLEYLEDGIYALDMLTKGHGIHIGDTITNEDFLAAFTFIMDQVKENITTLRADLTRKYMTKEH